MKRILIAAAALALAGTVSACGGDDDPKAEPTPTKSASPSPTTPPTPDPMWDNDFSPEQMQRYGAARDRWLEFWDFYTGAARKGVDTPGVRSGFEEYSMFPASEYSTFLDTYVRGGVRMEVPPKVLWTSASKIGKVTIIFNYCLDQTNARTVNVNGEVDPKDPPLRRLITVQMRNTAKGWLKQGYVNQDKVRSCPKTAP